MSDHQQLIGQTVISSNFGVGTVISIDSIGGNDRKFMVVESTKSSVKNFLPIDDENTYRFISDLETINKLFEQSLKKELPSFESKKDRIHFFKAKSQIQDLELMVELICVLKRLDDLGSAEQVILTKLVDSLALELSIITTDTPESQVEFINSKF